MNTKNLALEVIANETRFDNIEDAFAYGLPTALFGFAIVFAVLILIWGCLALFKVFFHTIPNARKNSSEAKPEIVSEPISDSANIQAAAVLTKSDNTSIIAAIIAAISAFRTNNGQNGSLRVVSFKKRK
jgi:hypothetical protein